MRIAAEGEGGNGENGAGGAGIGGRARLNADGAAYHVAGNATIVTDAVGGFGRDGGAASLRAVVDDSNNSGMFANNGGSIVVDGFASPVRQCDGRRGRQRRPWRRGDRGPVKRGGERQRDGQRVDHAWQA